MHLAENNRCLRKQEVGKAGAKTCLFLFRAVASALSDSLHLQASPSTRVELGEYLQIFICFHECVFVELLFEVQAQCFNPVPD